MGWAFTVNTEALRQAAKGVDGVTEVLDGYPVSDWDPNTDHVGDSDLHSAISDFTTRWELGLKQLVSDAAGTAMRLRASASVYENVEAQM